jgi:hypothetical protein
VALTVDAPALDLTIPEPSGRAAVMSVNDETIRASNCTARRLVHRLNLSTDRSTPERHDWGRCTAPAVIPDGGLQSSLIPTANDGSGGCSDRPSHDSAGPALPIRSGCCVARIDESGEGFFSPIYPGSPGCSSRRSGNSGRGVNSQPHDSNHCGGSRCASVERRSERRATLPDRPELHGVIPPPARVGSGEAVGEGEEDRMARGPTWQ